MRKSGMLIFSLLVATLSTFGQRTVTGRVVDSETKKPIKEADVTIKGTNITTKTNFMGYFQLTLDSINDLVINSTEYELGSITLPDSITKFQVPLAKIKPTGSKDDDDKIFMVVDIQAEFPGGLDGMIKFFHDNLKYPEDAKRKGIQGKVFVQFVVDKEGYIPTDQVIVIKGISKSCDEEAIRVVSLFPKWTPGMLHGKPVKSRFVLPIRF